MVIREMVKQTGAFKEMDSVQQMILLKHNSLKQIEHGYNMSKLTSFDKWVHDFKPRGALASIVEELIK